MSEPARAVFGHDELAYRLRQQRLLSEFGMFCLRTHDLAALLHEGARAAAEGTQCDLCKVLEHRPAQNDFLIVAGVGWHHGVIGRAVLGPERESPAGYAFLCGHPVISNELATDERFRTPPLLIEHGVLSATNVLIRGDASTYGVLEIDSTRLGEFDAADSDFLQGFANLLGVAIDRQRLEHDLKRNQRALQQALEHERTLIAEVHHRVKNSLALVSGLLAMQRRGTSNAEAQSALQAAEARIHSIAEVHDHLARHGKASSVPLDGFVGDLCRRLAAANPLHHLACEVVPVSASSERAIALGLLVNELVTNALKYAYPNGGGDVEIAIRASGDDNYTLTVSDRGVGMPLDEGALGGGLGSKVITSLARQLGGTVTWHRSDPGTRVVLEFPREPDVSAA